MKELDQFHSLIRFVSYKLFLEKDEFPFFYKF